VWAVHGVGGTLGAIATGVFAVAAIGGVKGAIEGNLAQVGTQLVAVAATWAFAGISTFVIIKAIDIVLGLRVAPSDEEMGLDLALHGEAAYQT
jgi:Amt family ammonium transporter